MKTDNWFYGLFQSAPDLIALLLPMPGAFRPRNGEAGTAGQPVVLLEVQMHAKAGFKHRLFAQTARFLQLNPQVLHLTVVVVVPHRRLKLGPTQLPQQLQAFLDGVIWLNLEELGQRADPDPLLALLALPVQSDAVLVASSQQILVRRPDLFPAVQTILLERLPLLTREDLMEIATIPAKDLRHTRVAQEWIEEGRQEGEARGRAAEAAALVLRQLNRRCGPLGEATSSRIQALPLEQLEALADALLDFSGPADLATWLAEHNG